MKAGNDHRPAEGNARPIFEVADLLQIGGLSKSRIDRAGPCPQCGGVDRFSLNARKNVFNCRRCGGKGGPLDLVQFVRGCSFPEALDWLCGGSQELTDAEILERQHKAAVAKARKDADAAKFRREAIAAARQIWTSAVPSEQTAVRDYLAKRGVTPDLLPQMPACLRFQSDARYMVPDGLHGWREIHRGPAMVAAVQGMDDTFCAVHRTWIDLGHPKGKLVLANPDKPDAPHPTKKVQGSKKGGAIRLCTPPGATVLVMAEGIETTLSALVANAIPNAAYWAGVDLGNMAGQRMMGKGLKYAGIPDMDDAEAFVPPAWVRRLVFVMDGDSEPRLTRAKLEAGLRRAMALRPGLKGQIVPVAAGQDLNDVLMGISVTAEPEAAARAGEPTDD